MEIVYRNLITLMSVGAFSTTARVEPMSRFKWNQLLTLADTYGVSDYVAAGIISMSTRDNSLIQKDIVQNAYSRYDSPQQVLPRDKSEFDFNENGSAKFAYFMLNRKLKAIVYNEIHSIDTSTATLALLYMIIDNINEMIYGGINFRLTITLGQYLRTSGDKIDFVKTEQWLTTLGIKRQANLVGNYLTSLFGFDANEVPFISKVDDSAAQKALLPLRFTLGKAAQEPDMRDYHEKMNQRLQVSDTRLLSRFAVFPAEVVSKYVAGIAKSLSNIEE